MSCLRTRLICQTDQGGFVFIEMKTKITYNYTHYRQNVSMLRCFFSSLSVYHSKLCPENSTSKCTHSMRPEFCFMDIKQLIIIAACHTVLVHVYSVLIHYYYIMFIDLQNIKFLSTYFHSSQFHPDFFLWFDIGHNNILILWKWHLTEISWKTF